MLLLYAGDSANMIGLLLMIDYKKLEELKTKVKGGNVGLLPSYLDMLANESLEKLKVCSPANLQRYQSRLSTLSEIKNLLG